TRQIPHHRNDLVAFLHTLQELKIVLGCEVVLLIAREVTLDQQVAVGRIYRPRRTMITRIANVQASALKRTLDSGDRVEIRLRELEAKRLHVLPDRLHFLLGQPGIGGRRVDVIDQFLYASRLPPARLGKRFPEEQTEIFDPIVSAQEQRLVKEMLEHVVAPNVYDDCLFGPNLGDVGEVLIRPDAYVNPA